MEFKAFACYDVGEYGRNVVRTKQNTPESLGRVVLEKGTEGRNRFRRAD